MVDDIDRAVVDALVRDGRASAREVADATGIAATTVARRMDQLVDVGVIESYTARVDYDRLGYDVCAIFRLSVDGQGLHEVTGRLGRMDRMLAVYEVTGTDDIVAIGRFRTAERMNEQIKELLTDEYIRSVTTSVVLRTVSEFEPLPLE
jgi:DNA-binding Lrp family transcriptional regulator